MDLNRAMLIGNITRDPEVRTTPSGQTVASFGLATNLIWTDAQGQRQTRAEFHNIVAWRKLADIVSQYLHKGSKVYVDGRLQTREWEGKDGAKRQRTEIVAENVIMLDRKADGVAPTPRSSTPTEGSQPAPAGEDEIQVENIPF